jgi:large subunit ribosomal protein L21
LQIRQNEEIFTFFFPLLQKDFCFLKKSPYLCAPKKVIIFMYAIVEIAGQQFKVSKDRRIFINRQTGEVGDKLSFDQVYLIENDSKTNVGLPLVSGASVAASIIAHVRGDKVLVFKKKRRKGYQKLNGHRQDYTQIVIDGIFLNGVNLSGNVVEQTT